MAERKPNKLNTAVVQMQSGLDIKQNFDQAVFFLKEAVTKTSSTLLVYPENFLCLGSSNYLERSSEINYYADKLIHEAKEQGASIVLGSIPIPYKGKCLSRSIFVDQHAKQLGYYDKVHLFDVQIKENESNCNKKERVYKESDSFISGDDIKVLQLNDFNIGLSICYDLRFPELYQGMRQQGADILTVPSAFTYKTGHDHWEILLRARAIENQCYVLAANQCGSHALEDKEEKRHTWGHSMIIDPWGKILCQLDNKPGVCATTLDFSELKRIRQSMNLLAHKKIQ